MSRRFSVSVPDWGQDHLSPEAIAAYVDDELADGPHNRATRHLSSCPECAAQVVAQGQARAALRSATYPSPSSSLLSSLQSIPQEAELPSPPKGLAVTADGQLVSVLRTDREMPAGLVAMPTPSRSPAQRRVRFGTGAAVTGLAFGALALGAAMIPSDAPAPSPTAGPGGAPSVVDAQLRLPGPADLPGGSTNFRPQP